MNVPRCAVCGVSGDLVPLSYCKVCDKWLYPPHKNDWPARIAAAIKTAFGAR